MTKPKMPVPEDTWVEIRKEASPAAPAGPAAPAAAGGDRPAPALAGEPVAAADGYTIGRLYRIDVQRLEPDPEQPRRWFDPAAMQELVASVRTHGVLQPVLFRVGRHGQPVLVAGERRLQAARTAGLAEIPALCTAGDAAEISLVENLLRENLTPLEEAEALGRLQEAHRYTQEQLAGVIGKAQSTLSEILSLNRLPEDVKDYCRNNPGVPRRLLVEVARKHQARSMSSTFHKLVDKQTQVDPRKGKPRPRRDPVERLVRPLEAAAGRLVQGVGRLPGEERDRLRAAWNDLCRQVEQELAALPPGPPTES